MKVDTYIYTINNTVLCMRIDTDLTEEDRTKVKEYADKKGLKLRRAYTELIKRGLEYATNTTD